MADRTCILIDCAKPVEARGLCVAHDRRLMRHGSTDDPRPSEAERFWSKVDKTDTCWVWTGASDRHGYGRFRLANREWILAHRYVLPSQEIAGRDVDHICHNPSCVRSDHLQVVTHRENSQNLRGAHVDNSTGIRGVSWDAGRMRYVVRVTHHGRSHWGGRHDTIEDAEAAAIQLRLTLHTNNLIDRVA